MPIRFWYKLKPVEEEIDIIEMDSNGKQIIPEEGKGKKEKFTKKQREYHTFDTMVELQEAIAELENGDLKGKIQVIRVETLKKGRWVSIGSHVTGINPMKTRLDNKKAKEEK